MRSQHSSHMLCKCRASLSTGWRTSVVLSRLRFLQMPRLKYGVMKISFSKHQHSIYRLKMGCFPKIPIRLHRISPYYYISPKPLTATLSIYANIFCDTHSGDKYNRVSLTRFEIRVNDFLLLTQIYFNIFL